MIAAEFNSRQILELARTDHDGGLRAFLQQWQAWRRKTPRSNHLARLHYVLILPQAPDVAALDASLADLPFAHPLRRLQRQLHNQIARQSAQPGGRWSPGFQRLELDQGRVLLTICIGPLKAMLKAQSGLMDQVLVSGAEPSDSLGEWDRWTAKALAQVCRLGCSIRLLPSAHPVAALLGPAGFDLAAGATQAMWHGRFAPNWQVKSSRFVAHELAPQAGAALVIGAGLAGAATAAALAHRGWQVQVLDCPARLGLNATNSSASDALDLPLGLFCPHLSKNDAPLSRLVRAGISLLTQRLPNLLVPGRDWALSGTMQTLFAADGPTTSPLQGDGQVWHAQAGWVKPRALIRALLATPGVDTIAAAHISHLRREAGMWQALDAHGGLLAQAPLLVLATSGGTAALLSGLQPAPNPQLSRLHHGSRLASLHAVHGQISWGYQTAGDALVLPRHPVNGHGHLSAHIPVKQRRAWYAGATYEAEPATPDDAARITHGHQRNFQRLQTLAPAMARHLADRFESGNLESWRGTRFATRDRLPLVGPWLNTPEPGLWVNTGLGSRGLSWCLLTAELLAARLHGEPLPIDAQLAGKMAL